MNKIQGKPIMPTIITKPTRIEAAGNKPIVIDEFIGRINSKHDGVSVALLRCPEGWLEPGQTPTFAEYTIVLKGTLRVAHKDGVAEVHAGQAIITYPGEWVQYSTPETLGAEYVAVCLPAYSLERAHRDI
jgi:mannose-6-phosphate isomerase-like protein (cupin superfamily)